MIWQALAYAGALASASTAANPSVEAGEGAPGAERARPEFGTQFVDMGC